MFSSSHFPCNNFWLSRTSYKSTKNGSTELVVNAWSQEDDKFHKDRSLNSQRISFLSLTKNCNHKGLGIYYLLSAFIFGVSGTLFSLIIRIELYSSGNRIISPENQNFYNISITLHGFLMIFFLVMPGLFGGFGNYFVVIFQGSPEVVYPRVNNFSILILFLSYLLLILSLISEFGGAARILWMMQRLTFPFPFVHHQTHVWLLYVLECYSRNNSLGI